MRVHLPTHVHLNPAWQEGWKGGDQRICKKISAGRPLISEATACMGTMLSRVTLEAKEPEALANCHLSSGNGVLKDQKEGQRLTQERFQTCP